MLRRRLRGAERGQSFAEFAIVLPILLLLVFGVYDFGRGMSANVTVTNASREGARYMAVHASSSTSALTYAACPGGPANAPTAPSLASAEGAAWRQASDASLTVTQLVITVRFYAAAKDPGGAGVTADDTLTCTPGSTTVSETAPTWHPAAGDWVTVEVSYAYLTQTPLIQRFAGQVTIDRITTMVLE